MAEAADFEMRDKDRVDTDINAGIRETSFNFPDIPFEQQTTEQLATNLKTEEFISSVRKSLNLTKDFDKNVYKHIKADTEGNIYYKDKRISLKRGGKGLLSLKTLLKNPDSREFLHKIGYQTSSIDQPETRDLETVAPEQAQSIQDKIQSFKVTEDWAKNERDKAIKQLSQTNNENDQKTLKETISYFDQIELQARRRYNEVVDNQFKRVNEIINDKSRSLGERLKELFRRDGLTIGAIITALGMTISTIVLSILPSPATPSPSPDPKPNSVKRLLLKLSNWLLDLAKKALSALPGIIGSLVSFLLKKAGELTLFLSEHLIILLLAVIMFISEFIFSKLRNRNQKQKQ